MQRLMRAQQEEQNKYGDPSPFDCAQGQDDDAKPRHSSDILLYFGVRVRVWVMVASTAELVKGMGRVVP